MAESIEQAKKDFAAMRTKPFIPEGFKLVFDKTVRAYANDQVSINPDKYCEVGLTKYTKTKIGDSFPCSFWEVH